MDNLGLLFSENRYLSTSNVSIRDRSYYYKNDSHRLTIDSLAPLIRFVNCILTRYPLKLPIIFDMGHVLLTDKLAYIVFECMCQYLIEDRAYKVIVNMTADHHIHTDGIHSSPLLLLGNPVKKNLDKYTQSFKSEIYHNHYRKVLDRDMLSNRVLQCQIMDDIANFQKLYCVEADCREKITEVIVELMGNAFEYGGENCLIDFDIAPNYYRADSSKSFVGINIAILNLSTQWLGTSLQEGILSSGTKTGRSSEVKIAYENHCHFFDENYIEDDFFNLAAFQHRVSSRSLTAATGGTGLTKLIESLQSKSDSDKCYVLSGKRKMEFRSEYLTYNSDGWLGFNLENDFITKKPDISLFSSSPYVFPGTAYNLNFVLSKEEIV